MIMDAAKNSNVKIFIYLYLNIKRINHFYNYNDEKNR